MEPVKNLFHYATKELSQDAFLIWLFENWNCDQIDVRSASHLLIQSFIKVDGEIVIESLRTRPQYKDMDIVVYCIVNHQPYVIVIEDKIESKDHNDQLERYKNEIKKNHPDVHLSLVFYKTSLILKIDRSRIEESEWNVYDIADLYHLFQKLTIPIKNAILFDYINNLSETYQELCGSLPLNINDWNQKGNYHHWIKFWFHTDWNQNGNYHYWINFWFHTDWNWHDIHVGCDVYRNQYAYLAFTLIGNQNETPYMEIRSRDFDDSRMTIRLLLYDVKPHGVEPTADQLQQWIERIRSSELFTDQNYRKQIGVNKSVIEVQSIEDLRIKIKLYAEEYRRIFRT